MKELIGRTLGRFRIVEQIGAGGMGVVYRARDERLDRDVAIKVLPERFALEPEHLARFEREAKAVARLDHPNILAIHDIGTEHGVTYAVMELLEGTSLRDAISGGGITIGKALEYAKAVATALAAAHDKGIVHRDLKPENVFLTSDGRIKVLDFGLAKLLVPKDGLATDLPTASLQTTPGALLGTLAYMAPEQVQGRPADHRSDIFALGVMLYEMLAGHRPFGGSTTIETAAAILQVDPKPISAAVPGVPPALERVLKTCLEKRPEDRYSSIHDLMLTLKAMEPSTETPPHRERSVRGGRRPYIVTVAIAAMIALFAVLTLGGLWHRFSGRPDVGPIRSIAVLPFENLSGDPEQEYFAEGMTEALISKLAQIASLDVISRTSVMLYRDSKLPLPQIARELGVDAIVEGSVMRGENDVRVTVQLIHGATDRHLWAADYQRPLRDILHLQGEVARAVAHEIDAVLTTEESGRLIQARTLDPEAHDAYLKGMHSFMLFTGDGLTQGTEYLERAIEIDPQYAEAYAALAAVELNSTFLLGLPPKQVVPQAARLAAKALELDPDNPDAVLVQGWIEMVYDWDWERAESSHLRALELGPGLSQVHSNYAYLLACRGAVEEAVSEANRAEKLDPLSPMASQQVGMMLYLAGHFDESIAQLESTIRLNPHYWLAYQRLAQALMATGDYDRGIEIMRRGIELAGPKAPRPGKHTLAALYARAGKREQAVKILKELEEQLQTAYVPPTDLAQIYAALGNVDEAFHWLEKAVEVRDADLFMIKVWPVWDPLRNDPRFGELLHRLNLSDD